jgi:hypothetical protein
MTIGTKRPETTPRQRSRRFLSWGAISLFTFALVSAANPAPSSRPNADANEIPIFLAQATTPTPASAVSPMEEPLRLINEAKKAIDAVKDYSCILVKKEKMDDKPPVENVMTLKVRAEPFSVNLRWLEPKSLAGQEAVYVSGKYDGKMRVKSPGILGTLGFLSLEPDDARAKATSRHAITETGLAIMINRFVTAWEKERRLNVTKVRIGDYEFNKRKCTRVETTQLENPENQFLFQRTVVFFDKETHLPIRVECYDWPTKEGQPGELAEVFSYVNLRLNVGLTDDLFNR